MRVAEAKAAIMQSGDISEKARASVGAVLSQVDEAVQRLSAATTGTSHAKIAEALARYQAAKEKLVDAANLLTAGQTAAHEYTTVI